MAPQAKLKFDQWFPYYARYFSKLADGDCREDVAAYRNDTGACSQVIDCIIANTTESIKSNMQAASITLGLMPVVLPFLAPSMTEMAILAQSWPVFFIIASLGTSAVSITRLPAMDSGAQPGEQHLEILEWLRDFLRASIDKWKGWMVAMKALVYTLALAAVANLVEVSYRTDVRTASGFRCGQNMMPLIWAELSIGCYGVAACAVYWRRRMSRRAEVSATLVAMQAEVLWFVAALLAELQLLFGIIVFSSLIFISMVDAIQVFLRIAASCALCRLLVTIAVALANVQNESLAAWPRIDHNSTTSRGESGDNRSTGARK